MVTFTRNALTLLNGWFGGPSKPIKRKVKKLLKWKYSDSVLKPNLFEALHPFQIWKCECWKWGFRRWKFLKFLKSYLSKWENGRRIDLPLRNITLHHRTTPLSSYFYLFIYLFILLFIYLFIYLLFIYLFIVYLKFTNLHKLCINYTIKIAK